MEGRFSQCEAAARLAIRQTPMSASNYVILAEALWAQGRKEEALGVFEGAIDARPWPAAEGMSELFRGITGFFGRHGLEEGMGGLLERAIGRYPDSDYLPGRLARELERAGQREEARRRLEQAEKLRGERVNAMTRKNYARLVEVLRPRGVTLVAVQYPGRPLAPLRGLFDSTEGILLVDNEASFNQALATASYDEIFDDHCYGDFGHATRRGNLILANNIADVILGKVSE